MPMNSKTSKKRSFITIVGLSAIVIVGILLLTVNVSFLFKKSIHEDAKRYATRHCLVFYPEGNVGKKYAKHLATDVKQDTIYDYSLVPYGDYYLVSYGYNMSYFVDKDYNELVLNEIDDNGKKIIADYLRYTIKKENPDLYFTINFLTTSTADHVDFSKVTYSIEGENIVCYFEQYDCNVLVPIKYLQKSMNMDFGYEDEMYTKPVYIDPSHPIICLTFDDGPEAWDDIDESSSQAIVDSLYMFDATGTFYVVGECLQERDSWTDFQTYTFLSNSISNGNEYGSHTQTHADLTEISDANIIKEISRPAEFLKEIVDYEVKTYRPPYGYYNEHIGSIQPYPAIMWSIDSLDWQSRDGQEIYDEVLSYNIEDGDILLFHEIYDSTADGIKKLLPELISRGYQCLTVSDLIRHEGLNFNEIHVHY